MTHALPQLHLIHGNAGWCWYGTRGSCYQIVRLSTLWHEYPIYGLQSQHPKKGCESLGRKRSPSKYNMQPSCCALEDRWVFHFAHLRQLPCLAPYIPISNPQLRDTVYEVRFNPYSFYNRAEAFILSSALTSVCHGCGVLQVVVHILVLKGSNYSVIELI
jgi:hypothetical protein